MPNETASDWPMHKGVILDSLKRQEDEIQKLRRGAHDFRDLMSQRLAQSQLETIRLQDSTAEKYSEVLEVMNDKLSAINQKLAEIQVEVGKLQVRSGVWGVMGGAIAALVAMLMRKPF